MLLTCGWWPLLLDEVGPGAQSDLPGVRLARFQDFRDLPERVVECLAQDVDGSLGGESRSTSSNTAMLSASALSAPRVGSSMVSTDSGSHEPM